MTIPLKTTRLTTAGGSSLKRRDGRPVEWNISEAQVPYDIAVATMEARAEAIARGEAEELVWLLEHPALFTAGTSAGAPPATRLPMHRTGRGGQITYHGPGQRVAYVMLDLQQRVPDLRAYVAALEQWIISALASFNIRGARREDRVGVWVERADKAPAIGGAMAEDKIAAIGVRVRRWVTFHGISLNVEPDLSHYAEITPCGIGDAHLGVTSFLDLGHVASLHDVDDALRRSFESIFEPTSTG